MQENSIIKTTVAIIAMVSGTFIILGFVGILLHAVWPYINVIVLVLGIAGVGLLSYYIYHHVKTLQYRRQQQQIKLEALYLDNEMKKAEVIEKQAQIAIALRQSDVVLAPLDHNVIYRGREVMTQIVEAKSSRPAQEALPPLTPKRFLPQHIPTAPAFKDMQELIQGPDHIVLGYTESRPVFGSVAKHMLSNIIMGMPGQGKSTALLYYLATLVKAGTFPIIFDPQGSLHELSGLFPYMGSFEEMYAAMTMFAKEIHEREQLWRECRQVKDPLFFLIDEVPLIAAHEKDNKIKGGIMSLIRKVVLECRKYACYCTLAGQSVPATVLPTMTRDNMTSRLIFASKDRQSQTAGLDTDSRKLLLPYIEQAGPGVGVLDMSVEKQPLVISIPYTEVSDITALVSGNEQYHQWNSRFTL